MLWHNAVRNSLDFFAPAMLKINTCQQWWGTFETRMNNMVFKCCDTINHQTKQILFIFIPIWYIRFRCVRFNIAFIFCSVFFIRFCVLWRFLCVDIWFSVCVINRHLFVRCLPWYFRLNSRLRTCYKCFSIVFLHWWIIITWNVSHFYCCVC